MSSSLHKCAEALNKLIRGELSAIETYDQAVAKMEPDHPQAHQLRQLQAEHREAAEALSDHVRMETTEEPSTASGWWGTWAGMVTGVARLFGNGAALKALQEGEEHGVKEYEEALEDKEIPESCKTVIRDRLLPRTRAHVAALQFLRESLKYD